MKSPYPSLANLKMQTRAVTETYKGETFDIFEKYYLDEANGNEEISDRLIGNATLNQVYNEYRVRHGLPFIDELRDLRERLSLSHFQMSQILGLGVNQYRLYESGTMPSDTAGRYIRTLIENDSALLICLNTARGYLTEDEYNHAIQFPKISDNDNYVFRKFFSKRCKGNGYAPLNLNKLRAVIQYFICNVKKATPNILNRLLFYTDFFSYRWTAMAVTGLPYHALPFGPVPCNWKYFPLIDGIGQHEDNMGTVLTTNACPKESSFNDYEFEALSFIIKEFGDKSSEELMELCINEPAWIENKDSATKSISFDYAFKLQAI